jgi:hypothetical protein
LKVDDGEIEIILFVIKLGRYFAVCVQFNNTSKYEADVEDSVVSLISMNQIITSTHFDL